MAQTSDPTQDALAAIARSIIESNRFMTLATADEHGTPWASPVWYAPEADHELFWVSKPGARHSQNLAVRPQLAIVIFDSHEAGGWNALYMTAVAGQVADVDRGMEIFNRRGEAQGFRAWARDEVLPPARHRLYRATVSEHFVLDSRDERHPVTLG